MKRSDLKLNDRVEYAARVKFELGGEEFNLKAKRHFVGYVKKIFTKCFRPYVAICECKTGRIDEVKLSDVYSKLNLKTNN